MATAAKKVAAKAAPAKTAPVAAKSAPAKKAAPVVEVAEPEEAETAPRSRGPRGTVESAVITLLVEGNPKREGSKAHAVFSYYEDGMTIGDFADALAEADLGKEATPNLVYDSKHGFISIEGYEPPGGVVVKEAKEPKAPKAEKPAKGKKSKEAVQQEAAVEAEAEEEVVD